MSSYQARIQAAVANGAIPAEPGGVTHVDVEHAKGCRADHGRRCICTPRITVIVGGEALTRSEEHTSELQSLMRISYAVFCLKKKKKQANKLTNKSHPT